MSMRLSPAVSELIESLKQLPGLGPLSAQRAAFALLKDPALMQQFAGALERAEKLHRCPHCNTFTEEAVCPVCADPQRDRSVLCVVESVSDQMALDASLSWNGQYFVLAAKLSPIDGVGPREAGFDRLLDRIEYGLKHDDLREVVVATSYTVEGDATAYYLIQALAERFAQLRVTRLPRGLPSGVEIKYTDLNTIANAVFTRKDV